MNVRAALLAARELIAAFKDATTSALAREILDRALAAAEADDCYQALKLDPADHPPRGRGAGPRARPTRTRHRTHTAPPIGPQTGAMPMMMHQATRAYEAAATHRSQREQEADVFRRAIGALKAARNGNALQRVRALADNRRLWMTVHDLMRDPDNSLPPDCAPRSFPSA